MSTTPPVHRRAGVAAGAALALGVTALAGAVPAFAATLDDYEIAGVQFVNDDCSRNEYAIDATVTGTTDDIAGFDRVEFQVWDDGTLKDSRTLEVAVGTTRDLHAFLSFVGLYGDGAPGVGIVINDVDADGNYVSGLMTEDPFFPEDVDGPCAFDVERIGGPTRIETAAMLSEQKFVMADSVVIATAKAYPDALTAAPWAAQMGAPLLLTNPGGLPTATVDELTRLVPEHVYVVGGSTAVTDQVLLDVEAAVPAATVERVSGADRYGTAGAIAQRVVQDSSAELFVASGQDFPDALVLSALAARHQAPLVLVKHDEVPPATDAAVGALSFDDVYAAGGTTVLTDDVLDAVSGGMPWTRYSGADRYVTAEKVLEQFPAEGKVLVATGQDFPDSLTAVPVAARTGAGVALTRPDAVPAGVLDEVERLVTGFSFPLITIVGGEVAVHDTVETQLLGLVGGLADPTERSDGGQTGANIPQE
ncbi:N-acetylmuramoyl-L-alanine amidase [Serinicoccus hydrothermalis]|uniref:N-acetylmuramoyl-L-alanine amidase n=1 Tax=Serinicoccus hydrothermalis TaxID=1758689 RepID=A0A1B1NEQ4_9MICO|nr:cell wall-binding repeat-containing protein [Serinicoccus hydrothermalis]ANS79916.1 N-acetylmuramoyl-L-alanine amidase [Serinicoccus hydrothermalis]